MINCIIVDDEPLAAQLLKSYAEKIEDVNVAGVFHNPVLALAFLKEADIDLVFLDIQMPELNGTQLVKIIDPRIKVIFTTAYPDYAVEGFELKALDYLVKPISFARFLDAVERCRVNTGRQDEHDNTDKNYLFVKSEYRLIKINLSDILYFQGMSDYCSIVCSDQKIMTLEKLKSFEDRLPKNKFLRVHKSYIIAIDKIEYVEKKRIKICDQMIPIGLTYGERLNKIIGEQ